MSSTTLASDHELQPTDILVPLDIDKDRLHWDGNPAHIKGILHAIGQYWERMGLFQPFIKDRAVLLSNGKMAVDSIQAVKFVSSDHHDMTQYSITDPCPPSPARITRAETSSISIKNPSGTKFVPLAAICRTSTRAATLCKSISSTKKTGA